jgi:F0F1-type ATP synthase assembly protein I
MKTGSQQNPDELNEAVNTYRKAAPYINAIYAFIGAVILFGGAGWWLDQKLHSTPLCILVGLFLGLGVGFYSLIKAVQKLEKNR